MGEMDVDAELEPKPAAGHVGGRTSAPEVRPSRPEDDGARDALVAAHPRGSVFHLSGWSKAVARVFGHARRDLLAWRDGRIVGVLPLTRYSAFPGAAHLISVPYAVEGGPLGAEVPAGAGPIEPALVEEAVRLAHAERVGRLELRCSEPLDLPQLVPSDLYVDFRQPLPADPAQVLSRFKKEERRLVRRARDTHGLTVSEGPWYVGELARLFGASKQRLGSPGLPLVWFRALQDELGERARVHVVRRGGELLAASMSFVFRDTFHMYYIGTTPEANREFAATSFLIAHLMEGAAAEGLGVYDLGRSRRDSGAASFKRNQGFEPRPLHYRYALVRSRGLPSLNPSNPRTRVLTETWQRLPPWLAQRLAFTLSRRLP